MEPIDLEQILQKSYDSLSAAELEAIQDICQTEEDFNQLKNVFQSIEQYNDDRIEAATPRAEIKSNLDNLFYQTHQRKPMLWYNSIWMTLYPLEKRFDQRPLVRIAAVLILALSVVPFLDQSVESPQPQLASTQASEANSPTSDTVIETPAVESVTAVEESSQKLASNSVVKSVSSGDEVTVNSGSWIENSSLSESEDALFAAPSTVAVKEKLEFKPMRSDVFVSSGNTAVKTESLAEKDQGNSSGFNPALLDVLTATY